MHPQLTAMPTLVPEWLNAACTPAVNATLAARQLSAHGFELGFPGDRGVDVVMACMYRVPALRV